MCFRFRQAAWSSSSLRNIFFSLLGEVHGMASLWGCGGLIFLRRRSNFPAGWQRPCLACNGSRNSRLCSFRRLAKIKGRPANEDRRIALRQSAFSRSWLRKGTYQRRLPRRRRLIHLKPCPHNGFKVILKCIHRQQITTDLFPFIHCVVVVYVLLFLLVKFKFILKPCSPRKYLFVVKE